MDIQGKLLFVNYNGLKMFKYDKNILEKGLYVKDILTPEDYKKSLSSIQNILKGEETKGVGYTGVKSDGTTFHLNLYSRRWMKDGVFQGTFGIVIDNTEKYLLMEKLKQSEEKFSKAFKSIPNIMGISTLKDGKYIEVNESFCNILKIKREDVIGKTSIGLQILDNETRELMSNTLKDKGYLRDHKCNFYDKEGGVHYGLFSAELMEFNKEKCILASVYDITNLNIIQKKLHKSQKKYKNLVENVDDLIFTEDLKGMFIFVNTAFEKCLGWTSEELIQKDISHLIHPDDLQIVIDSKQELYKCNSVKDIQYRFLSKSGEYHWFSTSAQPKIGSDGKIIEINGVGRDITLLKKLESERLRTQKLESLGIMAGGLAHDFNNLLVGILGNLNLLMYVNKDFDEETMETLKDVESAAHQAAELTKKLLTFSKGGAPIRKPENIIDIVKFCINLVLSGSKSKCNIYSDDNLPLVYVDEGQIQQVINNLLLNADQATKKGDLIDIFITKEKIMDNEIKEDSSSINIGTYIKVVIKDNGQGIPTEIQDNIFTPYFTTKTHGTGLGLATAFSIIKRHGGKISFSTKKGEGTSFIIYLPTTKKQKLKITDTKLPKITKSGKILILEDEETVIKSISRLLKELNQNFDIFRDGTDIIKKYKEEFEKGEPYDFLIIDLTIPGGMGGLETMQNLQSFDPNIKAVVSSGYYTDPIMANYKENGFCAALPKPYVINDLLLLLSEIYTNQ